MSPELEEIRRETERLTGAMAQADWHQAPPGKWNCAQILEHLRLTYTATTKGTLKALEMGRPLGGEPSWRARFNVFYVTALNRFPSGRTAPKNTQPVDGSGFESLRKFNDALVAMDAILADAEKRFGNKVNLLDHPILGPLTAQQWRRFHRTHARHHLKQIVVRGKSNSGRA